MNLPGFTAKESLYQTRQHYAAARSSNHLMPGNAVVPQQVPTPLPGCWFVGTQCRGFYQTCKFCCSDGGKYSQQCGWCVGWWNAPQCLWE
jgi:hypothetical protein